MIKAICDHCKEEVKKIRGKKKDLHQMYDDNGEIEADLCKDCYEVWCKRILFSRE